eukprot:COSAG02_NODE_1690_length_11299_cov_21.781071_4_plen_81_part_00
MAKRCVAALYTVVIKAFRVLRVEFCFLIYIFCKLKSAAKARKYRCITLASIAVKLPVHARDASSHPLLFMNGSILDTRNS